MKLKVGTSTSTFFVIVSLQIMEFWGHKQENYLPLLKTVNKKKFCIGQRHRSTRRGEFPWKIRSCQMLNKQYLDTDKCRNIKWNWEKWEKFHAGNVFRPAAAVAANPRTLKLKWGGLNHPRRLFVAMRDNLLHVSLNVRQHRFSRVCCIFNALKAIPARY